MDYKTAKETIRESWEEILIQITEPAKTKVNGRTSYICPICNHGENGDGLTINPKSKGQKGLKCFGFSGYIINLIGDVYDIDNFSDQLKKAGELIGIEIDDYHRSDYKDKKSISKQSKKERKEKMKENEKKIKNIEKTETETDYTDFFLQANKNLTQTDYYRGISLETLNRFRIGYCESWKHPKRPKTTASPRLVLPTSRYSYVARDARTEIPEDQKKDKIQLVGKARVFNRKALREAKKPIYVVESVICALSINDVGGEAVATLSANFINQFMQEIKENRPKQPLILAFDNDKAGEMAREKLKKELDEKKIDYYIYNLAGEHKDPNEALVANREKFAEAVKFGEDRKAVEQAAYRKTSAYYRLPEFMDGIAESVNTPAQTTGFKRLDEALNGGLRKGLYLIGAITSLGKTTLVLQIADQIAQTGRDVLIFTLEMDAAELISKSISRETFISEMKRCGKSGRAKTDIGISDGSLYKLYNQKDRDLINRSIEAYGKYSNHIFYREGMGDIGVDDIRKEIAEYKRVNGTTPIVVIDYIQILKPEDIRATDKKIIDTIVSKLARLAREFKIPIIGISSFNRENYTNKVTFKAFKESGSIEYSGDVVMGLQFHGAGEDNFKDTEAKRKNPRQVELIILKARKARVGAEIKFEYNAFYNHFKEVDDF